MVRYIDSLKAGHAHHFSLEIVPPDRGRGIDHLMHNLEKLMKFDPRFINVTYHQPHVEYMEIDGTIIRCPVRKKPGTVGICAAIKNRFDIDTIPHFICGGFNRYEVEDALIDLNFLGIQNIFAVRGDPPPSHKEFIPENEGHTYAWELVEQIQSMNAGHYINSSEESLKTDFCIGVAGYPEKHCEAPNMQRDLLHLKEKVEKGADYIITQMIFDFQKFKNFVEMAREIGITVPIIPGIKPVVSLRQIERIPNSFHVAIPDKLINTIEDSRTKNEAFEKGTEYMANLVDKLLSYGVDGIHIFTMGLTRSTRALLQRVFES